MIKIWIDDERNAPATDYIIVRSVYRFFLVLGELAALGITDFLLDLDHDAGEYAREGGDYIKILEYLSDNHIAGLKISVKFHSMNPVGVKNMRRIVENCSWLVEEKP